MVRGAQFVKEVAEEWGSRLQKVHVMDRGARDGRDARDGQGCT